jgi:hypothetical protein
MIAEARLPIELRQAFRRGHLAAAKGRPRPESEKMVMGAGYGAALCLTCKGPCRAREENLKCPF